MTKSNFMIYGSYGYSGNLIAELACKQGLKPVLAGRNKDKLIKQADKLGLEYITFDIANLNETKQAIQKFIAVIHCAGPFIKTFQNMAQACIETQTHYIDITGEFRVIEALINMNEKAIQANIMLLPGAGFDVVPSDCLAQYLKNKLPDATQLTLAIHALQKSKDSGLSVSRGTARTMAESLAEGSMIRDEGILKKVPFGWKKRTFNFGDHKSITCTTIAWGDLVSAWWSTRIPHIETYMSTPLKMIRLYKFINPIKFIFKWRMIKQFIQRQIDKLPEGPDLEELQNSKAGIYGEVTNSSGKKVAAIIQTPNGYTFTALSAVLIIKKILEGNAPVGFQTPSTAYTKDLVFEIPGVSKEDVN